MTSLRAWVVTIAFGLAAALVAPGSATAGTTSAGDAGRTLCVPVSATGVGQDLGGGQTTATIYSHGIRLGTTAGTFTITGLNGTVASFEGPIVFTGPGGTITAPVTGTLDTATGDFVSTSSSVTGTGLYAVVTGALTFAGTENLVTGSFTETITGTLCVPRHR